MLHKEPLHFEYVHPSQTELQVDESHSCMSGVKKSSAARGAMVAI